MRNSSCGTNRPRGHLLQLVPTFPGVHMKKSSSLSSYVSYMYTLTSRKLFMSILKKRSISSMPAWTLNNTSINLHGHNSNLSRTLSLWNCVRTSSEPVLPPSPAVGGRSSLPHSCLRSPVRGERVRWRGGGMGEAGEKCEVPWSVCVCVCVLGIRT